MPKYFQHLFDGRDHIEDFEGSEFPDAVSAIADAEEGGRQMLAERVRAGQVVAGQRIEIQDEAGSVVGIVGLRGLLRLEDD
jgi:hypothetical protein